MICSRATKESTPEQEKILGELNTYSKNCEDRNWRPSVYLSLFLEAVRIGAISEILIGGTQYEVYADILETVK